MATQQVVPGPRPAPHAPQRRASEPSHPLQSAAHVPLHRSLRKNHVKGSSYGALRGQLWLLRNINPFLEWASETLAPAATLQGREIIFQNLVHRALDRLEIDEPLYPLRSAAGYSYLYLLIRLVEDLPVTRVLELGCGQSTLLLDRLGNRSGPLECVALEHDQAWLDRIRPRVSTRLVHAPLVDREVLGHVTRTYETGALADEGAFDVLLVDGPRGSRRRSRWGCLELMETHLGEDFLIIIDDAERRGELETIGRALKLLDQRGRRYGSRFIRSVNSQFLIAGGRFTPALYF